MREPLVRPEITDDTLRLHVEGLDKLWAFKSELAIPLRHITSVRSDAEVTTKWFHGVKWPGTSVLGVITAGTFYQDGKRVFWDIHHPERAVVITPAGESYNELVIEVQDPDTFIADLQQSHLPISVAQAISCLCPSHQQATHMQHILVFKSRWVRFSLPPLQRLQLLQRPRPILPQQPRQTPIRQHPPARLASRAVIRLVVRVPNALNFLPASRTSQSIPPMHRHILTKRSHLLRKARLRLTIQPVNP